MSRLGVYKIQGRAYDLDDLTLDEMGEIEELAGGIAYGDLDFRSSIQLKALAFVLMKRTEPDIRLEDIGRVRMLDFVPPEEKMPPLPPDDADRSPNGSVRDDSGARPSPASISG